MSTITPAKPATPNLARAPAVDPTASSSLVAEASPRQVLESVALIEEPNGLRAEAIRALRTHIVAQHVNSGRRALAVCAASAGVGCTFVAANLAVALSQIGIKTLLIDADLRQATPEGIFASGAVVKSGLQQCLASPDLPFSDAIDIEVLPNLSVLRSGGLASNPQELLAGARFQELIDVCLRDFDMTIVDTPPANVSADARRISNVVGYSLVVARRNKSLVDDVKTLVAELQGDHAQVVGTVLNES